ncbi:hypothetical protein B9Z19DRAFT_1064771 [Tuber borchii]|uniref:Uncharacterized protein n=1 Tax=Tuber borchii TaxID=42251 RepID=A0A2T6ZTL1_TUBBO|nr:hypothetical protein B9Z19DRAFT_1064771 [Tuber borchii]
MFWGAGQDAMDSSKKSVGAKCFLPGVAESRDQNTSELRHHNTISDRAHHTLKPHKENPPPHTTSIIHNPPKNNLSFSAPELTKHETHFKMFRFTTRFLLNRQLPIVRYLTMTTPRPGIPNNSKTRVEFSPHKELLSKDKEPVSVHQAASPSNAGSDEINFEPTDSSIKQHVYRLEDKPSEFAQAIRRIDGNIRTIKWQYGILLTAVCGTGGALLYWLIKGELSKSPKSSDVEKMVKKAAKNQGLKIAAEQSQAASKVPKAQMVAKTV